MKKLRLLFVAVLLSTISVQAQEWKTFTSEKGNYSIEYLGDISKEYISDSEKVRSYKVNISNVPMAYLISATKHNVNLEDNIDLLLDTSLNAFNEAIKGTIKETKELDRNGIKGVYALITMNDDTIKFEYYLYMKGMYQYQLVFYAETATYNQEEANLLIASFKMLE